MNKFLIKIPITRKNFDKTKSSKYKGYLSFVSNEFGVIYDWKISLNYVEIDVLTTKKWFTNSNINYRRRNKLFNLLGLKQKIRTSRKNELHLLNKSQLEILNDYLNNRTSGFNSTLKSILPLLKGNNPGGEASKPNGAELIIDNFDGIRNFVILIDDLTMLKRVVFESAVIGAKELSFDKFVKLNDTLGGAFKFMQKEKDYSSWKNYLESIKVYCKKYNNDLKIADDIAKKARSKYTKTVAKVSPLPFGFNSNKHFQKCHIYEFWELRDKIIEALRNKKSTSEYESMISDINNFLPLPEHIHRQFDRHVFTYKTNGDIYPINEEGFEFIKEIDEKYKKIPDFFLTKKRMKYLSIRNEHVVW